MAEPELWLGRRESTSAEPASAIRRGSRPGVSLYHGDIYYCRVSVMAACRAMLSRYYSRRTRAGRLIIYRKRESGRDVALATADV